MKNLIVSLFISLFSFSAVASPVFNPTKKYRIACLQDGAQGGIVLGSKHESNYPLFYYSAANSATTDAYWYIIENEGTYSFKNASTGQYISYDIDYTTNRNLGLVSALNADMTLFSLTLHSNGGIDYYSFKSENDPTKFFNKRGSGLVGLYSPSSGTSSNELFAFYDEDNNVVKDDRIVVIPQKPDPVVAGPLATYFTEFTLSGKPLVYNSTDGSYFFSVPLNLMDADIERTIHFIAKNLNGNYSVTIDGAPLFDEDDYVFSKVTAGKKYSMEVKEGTTLKATLDLTFTGLPIVQIYYDAVNSSEYLAGYIKVHEPDKKTVPEFLHSEYKYRGATALGQPKKSFNIKLKDGSDQKLFRSFFGLREDNNWVLDAMAIDPGRMRNRVSTDLWNDFSRLPYHSETESNVINGTRGQFVELFINDQYNGLYCMTEKVDRKQLQLKKYDDSTQTVRGVLYKASGWNYSNFMGHYADNQSYPGTNPPDYNNSSETWDGYEVKHPDFDEQPVDWKPLYDLVAFNATAAVDSARFVNGYKSYFDMPVWLDYYLFIDLLLATDNHGKNTFIYTYDKNRSNVMSIAPWDLDGTFGRRWDGSNNITTPNQDFVSFLIQYEHGEYAVFRNLKKFNPDNYNLNLRYRYAELRKTYFTKESLMARFLKYKEMFDKSGAGARETAKWSGSNVRIDLNAEMTYLSSWLDSRLNYLDVTEFDIAHLPMQHPVITLSTPKTLTYGNPAIANLLVTTNPNAPLKISFSKSGVVEVNGNTLKMLNAGSTYMYVSQAASIGYSAVDTSFYLQIDKRSLVAKADDKVKEIGDENPALSMTYAGLASGDTPELVFTSMPTVSCAAVVDSPIGTYPILIEGGVANSNYVLNMQNGTLTINARKVKKTPVITLELPDTITYGDAPIELNPISSNTYSTVTLYTSKPGVVEIKDSKMNILNVGSLYLIASQPGNDIYASTNAVIKFLISVQKKTLYAVAEDQIKEQGQENPSFTIRYEGLVLPDQISNVVTSAPVVSCDANATSEVGEYPILLSGGSVSANYQLERKAGVLTILPNTGTPVEAETIQVGIAPNPVQDILNLSQLTTGVLVQLFDSFGRVIYVEKATEPTIQIRMESQSPGIYYLKIGEDTHTIIKK
ncbi:MAG: CotH kinase family protein [Bacteroidales bacterium]|nr:CotH kinase family protein [Bacteroidales bacterium]MDD4821044.1 CotH kinase family protein [Bacteroidales bacterium]